jgi:ureidoacrylate peracid hydrolase
MQAAFAEGSYGHSLWPELEVLPGDIKLKKNRFGAFVPGSSELHAVLQARNIDTVIITGTATNVCCESTARDAMMMNYKVIFVPTAPPPTMTKSTTQRSVSCSRCLPM